MASTTCSRALFARTAAKASACPIRLLEAPFERNDILLGVARVVLPVRQHPPVLEVVAVDAALGPELHAIDGIMLRTGSANLASTLIKSQRGRFQINPVAPASSRSLKNGIIGTVESDNRFERHAL